MRSDFSRTVCMKGCTLMIKCIREKIFQEYTSLKIIKLTNIDFSPFIQDPVYNKHKYLLYGDKYHTCKIILQLYICCIYSKYQFIVMNKRSTPKTVFGGLIF